LLAIALLLIGAAFAAWLAIPDYDAGASFGPIAGVSVAAAQIALAAALFWRVPGAWFVAAATLGFHLMMLSVFGVLVLIFGPDHSFLSVTAIAVAGFGVVVLYSLAITSARERGAGRSASTKRVQ
jgi:hypothetical protein